MTSFIAPSVETIVEKDLLRKLRLIYAVCYKNEKKIDWEKTVEWIERKISAGHTSPCEHIRIKLPLEEYNDLLSNRRKAGRKDVPYGFEHRINIHMKTHRRFVELNVRDWLAIGGRIEDLPTHKEAEDYATFRITCDRGITHEIVRHRVLSFTQESTRYVNYLGRFQFIDPSSAFAKHGFKACVRRVIWRGAMRMAAIMYSSLLKLGASPQEARSVLPNSTKAEIIVSGTFKSWETFFALRLSSASHPQMRQIAHAILTSPQCPNKMKWMLL